MSKQTPNKNVVWAQVQDNTNEIALINAKLEALKTPVQYHAEGFRLLHTALQNIAHKLMVLEVHTMKHCGQIRAISDGEKLVDPDEESSMEIDESSLESSSEGDEPREMSPKGVEANNKFVAMLFEAITGRKPEERDFHTIPEAPATPVRGPAKEEFKIRYGMK